MPWEYQQKLRNLLSQEKGYVLKNEAGKISVALVYPNSYHVGMSNLGFQKIYSTLNKLDYVVCERAFLPSPEEISILNKSKSPILSLETQKILNKFDIIAFSITFEMDYLFVLEILKLSRVPLKTSDRTEKDPIIMAGGICPTFNPEPLANFIDLVVIGEGEEVVNEIMGRLNEDRNSINKKKLSTILNGIGGVYIPAEYCWSKNKSNNNEADSTNLKIKKRWLKNIDLYPTSTSIVTDQTIFGDMFLVEVGKGCKMKCKFCEAGFISMPTRNYSTKVILEEIQKGTDFRNKIGLVGSAIGDHPEIEKIFKYIHQKKLSFSVSSLRLGRMNANMLNLLTLGGCKTVTVAPEAGSERLRKAINKNLSDETLFSSVRLIAESGINNLKLYYIIGLPGETDEDINGMIKGVKSILHIFNTVRGKKHRSEFLLTVSVNIFIPKPMTPFQRKPMENISSLKAKLKRLKAGFKVDNNVKLIYDIPKWAAIQTILSRGDKNTGNLLLKTVEQKGDWFKAIRELDLDLESLIYREINENTPLPWDFIDIS